MRALRGHGLRASLIVAAMAATTLTSAGMPAHAATHPAPKPPNACLMFRHHPGHAGGVTRAAPAKASLKARCGAIKSDSPGNGTPPLLFHGGQVMKTPVVITPIYWNPTGHPMAAAYKNLISQYWADVAHDSGMKTNVFAVLTDYSINYQIVAGAPISDTNALPSSGCTVAGNDKTGIYADGTGYNACLDDAQIQAQTNSVIAAHGLTKNLSHLYVLYLPKAVESCINAGSTTTSTNECSINHQPSAAFCAYHNEGAATLIYADLVFPIYQSPTGFTCGSDGTFGVIESPNNNKDGDTVINTSSAEAMDAITDPDNSTGWYDSSGFEISDECSGVYDMTQGPAGGLYNQIINTHHYLTQAEYSNTKMACVLS